MEQYICIHGHFYQPPRDNPWLEAIEIQDSAYPYHDWNERIATECYEPNTGARILNDKGKIVRMVDNYAKISFNFGPTLLSWMQANARHVYQAVLDADRESQRVFSGHGSALAQAYNHMVLPLANYRDKYTQVLWGIRDFEHRFGWKPEGMWLPEAAVDLETLDIMAELGIAFTVLGPRQAQRVRRIGDDRWQDVGGGRIDPTMAYRTYLPSGRSIAIFFYDEPVSRAVAFEGLLDNGDRFAERLFAAFSDKRTWPQIVHIATDGETYGHHHRFGEMALAYAISRIESGGRARLTNYGEYLERHPPTHEVEIIERTSWSCAHGVERWRSNCGCNTGRHPGWNQEWRAPLRTALDWLRDTLSPMFEERAEQLVRDPWQARNDYISVVLDRSPENLGTFFAQHSARKLTEAEKMTALKLMECQRHAMLMYTSCGWYFDDLSGIEAVQIMHYAARAVELAQEISGDLIETQLLELLEQARSNLPEKGDGRQVYEKYVRPSKADAARIAAHYAISSVFEERSRKTKVYCYGLDVGDYRRSEAGGARLALGWARVVSEITGESAALSFGVLHSGQHNLNAGVGPYLAGEAYRTMVGEVTQAFSGKDFPQVVHLLDKHLGTSSYSLVSLLRDEQRMVLDRILESVLDEIEATYSALYDRHYPPMRFLTSLGYSIAECFHSTAAVILNYRLRRALGSHPLDVGAARTYLVRATSWKVNLDAPALAYTLERNLEGIMDAFSSRPGDIAELEGVVAAVQLALSMPFWVNLSRLQKTYYDMLTTAYREERVQAARGDRKAGQWATKFASLGELLSIQMD